MTGAETVTDTTYSAGAGLTLSGTTFSISATSVTNAMLQNSSISIAGESVSLGGNLTAATLRQNLGLSSALRFLGTTTTTMSDGRTTAAIAINNTSITPTTGDVVIYGDGEYVWTGSAWEHLGGDGSYKTVQSAVSAATTASTAAATTFVSAIEQDANGVIKYTTKVLPVGSTSITGIVMLSSATNSSATNVAATPSAVKAAYDLAASKSATTGTVTSVRVQATSPVVSSSSAASSSTLNTTISLADNYGDTKNPYASKTANYVLASGTSAAAVPTFRKLVAADIPSLTKSKISDFPTNISTFTNDSGYVTSSGVTSITLKAGAGISLDTDNTAITSTGTRTINIAGLNISTGSTSSVLSQKGTWVNLPTVTSLGLDNLYKAIQTAVTTATDNNTTNTRFVSSITQDINGVISVTTELCPVIEVVKLI